MNSKLILSSLLLACAVNLSASNDSTYQRVSHQLNAIEVLGVKQMPSTGSSPVTKINAAMIKRLGIVAIKDVAAISPNLYIPSYGSRMTSSIYMRGMGSRIDRPVVGLTVDGVPIMNKDAYDFDIPEIRTIDILRGPQSVLNGQNAMAGQINVYTLSPRDFQGWRISAEYGRANSARASIGGYFKVKDYLFTSLSGYFNHTDGFWRNNYNNSRVGIENSGGARWKTVYAPNRALSITNTAALGISQQSGYPYTLSSSDQIAYNDTCYYNRTTFSDGLTVAWAGKRVVVTSLTSVQYIDDNMTLDQDFTPADYFTLTQKRKEWTVTQDLFTKGTRGDYSWLGGVFGFGRKSSMQAPVTFYDTGISSLIESNRNNMNPAYPISWDKRDFLLMSDFSTSTYGFALYHESKFNMGEWSFDAGLRWDIERITCDYQSDADATYTTWKVLDNGEREFYSNTPVSIHDRGNIGKTYSELLPKLCITYNLSCGHIFASLTKGYKMGGINTQMFSDVLQQRVMETMGVSMPYKVDEIVTYKPESSWNYEIGTKLSLLNDKLSAEAVVYFIDCQDQQLTMFPPGLVTGRIMTNAGQTYSRGVELSAFYSPIEDLQITASYGFNHATFHKYDNGRQDFAGNRVPYSPAHTAFVMANWRLPIKIGTFIPSLNASVRGVGDIMWNEVNTIKQSFYMLPNLSLTLQSEKYSVKFWCENISNTKYNTFYFESMGRQFVQQGEPTTFGATLSININKN